MRKTSSEGKLGKRIAASRLQQGLSQRVAARRAGLDPSYLSRIETGKVHPTVGTALRIAKALRVSLEALLGPSLPEQTEELCHLSPSGHCFLELFDANHDTQEGLETFSPRQIRLLRRIVKLVQQASPSLLRSLEVLVGELLEGGAKAQPSPRRPIRRRVRR